MRRKRSNCAIRNNKHAIEKKISANMRFVVQKNLHLFPKISLFLITSRDFNELE